jgi:hypothetical protein
MISIEGILNHSPHLVCLALAFVGQDYRTGVGELLSLQRETNRTCRYRTEIS